MGSRKIAVSKNAAEQIAAIAWYIESRGMLATAEKVADSVYNYFLRISDTRKSYRLCREPERSRLGYKCISFKKKYTIVFIETDDEMIITEFISSKLLHW